MTFAEIDDFRLERYFARFEFDARHQLSASDVEPLSLGEVLDLADDDARERWNRLSLGYTESMGLPALRQEIARGYEGIAPEQVLVVAGAEEGIFLTMHAALQAGDHVVVVTPAYQSLYEIAASLGVRVHRVELRAERRWALDPHEIERAITPRTRMIVLNFPHNPTGAHIDAAVQRRLVEIADGANALLFSDEVYRGLEVASAGLAPAAELSASAVSLGVMSKTFALAGLRIGWIATRNASLLERVARLKDYTTICSSAPSEILALIALRARDRVVARSREIVAANRELAAAFVARRGDVMQWVPPLAGSTAFPEFHHLDAEDVARRLFAQERVLLVPGPVFGAGERYFRLGLGRRDFPAALAALERTLPPVA